MPEPQCQRRIWQVRELSEGVPVDSRGVRICHPSMHSGSSRRSRSASSRVPRARTRKKRPSVRRQSGRTHVEVEDGWSTMGSRGPTSVSMSRFCWAGADRGGRLRRRVTFPAPTSGSGSELFPPRASCDAAGRSSKTEDRGWVSVPGFGGLADLGQVAMDAFRFGHHRQKPHASRRLGQLTTSMSKVRLRSSAQGRYPPLRLNGNFNPSWIWEHADKLFEIAPRCRRRRIANRRNGQVPIDFQGFM